MSIRNVIHEDENKNYFKILKDGVSTVPCNLTPSTPLVFNFFYPLVPFHFSNFVFVIFLNVLMSAEFSFIFVLQLHFAVLFLV